MNSIQLYITDKQNVGVDSDVFESYLQAIIHDHDLVQYEGHDMALNLVITDDHEIQMLNKSHRAKDMPTDVLSFSYIEPTPELLDTEVALGDVIISSDTAKKQALEQNHSLAQELEVLFVHGVLHILGYDHESPTDLQEMLLAEKRYLGDKSGLIQRVSA